MSGQNYEPLPVCTSSLSRLNRHGESLRIYFSFMKLFIYCFIVCGALGGLNTYINVLGYQLTSKERKTYLDVGTLANFYGFPNATMNAKAQTWVEDAFSKKILYFFFDLSYSALIVWCIYAFKVLANVIRI